MNKPFANIKDRFPDLYEKLRKEALEKEAPGAQGAPDGYVPPAQSAAELRDRCPACTARWRSRGV